MKKIVEELDRISTKCITHVCGGPLGLRIMNPSYNEELYSSKLISIRGGISCAHRQGGDLVEFNALAISRAMVSDLALRYSHRGFDEEVLVGRLMIWVLRCYAAGDLVKMDAFKLEKRKCFVNTIEL